MVTFRQNICFYISVVIRPYIYRVNISPKLKSWNITYMDRYMPLVGIYWSIYVILKWFKRSGLILTDICNGLITPDIWKHIWAEYVCIYRAILKYIDRYMKIFDKFPSIYVVQFTTITFNWWLTKLSFYLFFYKMVFLTFGSGSWYKTDFILWKYSWTWMVASGTGS